MSAAYYNRENRRHRDLYRWQIDRKGVKTLVRWVCKVAKLKRHPRVTFNAVEYMFGNALGIDMYPETNRVIDVLHELAHCIESRTCGRTGHSARHRVFVDMLAGMVRAGWKR